MTNKEIDRRKPTWANQIWHAEQLLAEKGLRELRRHASISLDNRHECRECFCCACVHVLKRPKPRSM